MSGGANSKKRTAARRSAPRALLFIGACFVASAATRVGDVGVAVAEAAQGPGLSAASADVAGDRMAAADPAPEPAPLLRALREQTSALEAREARVAERERLLEIAEIRLREEILRLEEIERKLASTLAVADGAAERDVAHLVGVYESMKPKAAAEIFATMEPSFAAGFLARMKPEAAAALIAELPSEAAYAVTAVMAARHADTPAR